jgi:hypothetical protein
VFDAGASNPEGLIRAAGSSEQSRRARAALHASITDEWTVEKPTPPLRYTRSRSHAPDLGSRG